MSNIKMQEQNSKDNSIGTIFKNKERVLKTEFDNDVITEGEFTEIDDTSKEKIDTNKIISEISARIVGQEEAIVTLVTNIYYNQVLIDELSSDYFIDLAQLDSRKVGILLDGSTGTGKTAILKDIASRLDLPIYICNANSFSETGYVGPSITDILRKLYFIAGRSVNKAERGIVVLDEIDKLSSRNSIDSKDMKKGVQEELLGFISGGEYDFPLDENLHNSKMIHFDTSKLTFILSGAFTSIKERKRNELEKKKKRVGFSSSDSNINDESYIITAQDYIDEGMHREFFGRVKVLTSTRTYNYDDLKTILLTSTISPLKNFEKTVQMFGYSGITYTDDFIHELCTQALEMGTGARALQTIMSGVQNRLLRGLINQSFDMDKKIDLTSDLLHDYNKSLVRRF